MDLIKVPYISKNRPKTGQKVKSAVFTLNFVSMIYFFAFIQIAHIKQFILFQRFSSQ